MRILARIPGIIPARDENGRFIKPSLETSVVMVSTPSADGEVTIEPAPVKPPSAPVEPEISVIVPVYKNRQTLRELTTRLRAALPGRATEIVFVNDACPEGSGGELGLLADEFPGIIQIQQPRNFGNTAALLRGLAEARGHVHVFMDADLQDPPEALPALIEVLEKGGYGAVFAGHNRQQAASRTSRLLQSALTRLAGVPEDAAGFVVFNDAVRTSVLAQRLRNRYLPAMIAASGAALTSLPVEPAQQKPGESARTEPQRWSEAAGRVACVMELAWQRWRNRGR